MHPMTWSDVLADPSLQNLPYKIELNRAGRIEPSPVSNTWADRVAKAALYLAAGAQEVWIQSVGGERRVVKG
jgi:hypothetical protein